MQANTTIEGLIYSKLRQENEEERASHIKSGKLSAGTLGSPLQHQILSALKAESKKVDDYTLGKFKRGKEVEDFIKEGKFASIFIKADRDASLGVVVKIWDVCKRLGIEKIGIATTYDE